MALLWSGETRKGEATTTSRVAQLLEIRPIQSVNICVLNITISVDCNYSDCATAHSDPSSIQDDAIHTLYSTHTRVRLIRFRERMKETVPISLCSFSCGRWWAWHLKAYRRWNYGALINYMDYSFRILIDEALCRWVGFGPCLKASLPYLSDCLPV